MPLDPPNPYRVENQFLLLRGLVLLTAGVALLWLARAIDAPLDFTSASPSQGRFVLLATGGVLLLLLGIWEFVRITRQLHADIGPEQPASLAPEIASHQHGASESALKLAEIVRKGALPPAKAGGELTGVISALTSHFMHAPLPLRDFVQTRVANLIAGLGLLLLFAITWYFRHQNTLVRSTLSARSHCSVVNSCSGLTHCSRPALLNAPSSRP